MSARLELDDLPPRYRAQAEKQRDYIHRRRMFIDLVAEPQHWRFIEHITPDTAEEIRKWKRLAEQAGKDSSWEKAGQGCQHSTGRASRMQ